MVADLPERVSLLDPILSSNTLALLYGPRGLGKTFVALGIAWAVASGGSFLGWRAAAAPGRPCRRRNGGGRPQAAARAVQAGAADARFHPRRSRAGGDARPGAHEGQARRTRAPLAAGGRGGGIEVPLTR